MSASPERQEPPLSDDVRRLIDSLPRAVVVLGPETLEIVAWSSVAERVFGWDRAEVLGRQLTDVLHGADDPGRLARAIEVAATGEVWLGELELEQREGEPVRIHAQVAPCAWSDDLRAGVVISAENVTGLQQLERRAVELAEHLTVALEAGRLGTWRWDLRTGTTTWDDTMCRLFGLEPGTFDGTFEAWRSRLHPDDAERTAGVVDAAVAGKASYEVEHRVIWPDGSVHWLQGRGRVTLDEAGEVTGTIGCTSDVTERKLEEIERENRIDRAEADAELERLRRERVEFLATLNQAALVARDPASLMRQVTNAAVPRLGDWCTIHFFGEPGDAPLIEVAHADPAKVEWIRELQLRFPYDPAAPTGVPAVVRTGQPEFVQIDRAFLEQRISESTVLAEDEAWQIVDQLQLTSLIAVPLISPRGVVGAMQFVSAESNRVYNDDDFVLAEAAAGRIAASLDNAWMAEQHRRIASTLQQALLPVAVPTIEGLSVAVRYWAAGTVNDVGGDFYDVFPIGPDKWAVAIGDVCGTGPQAAAVTAKARHTIRAAATHGCEHIEVLEWVNDAILAGNRDRFCTVLFATVERAEPGRWIFTSVVGGHPLPIRVDAGGTPTPIGRPGTLVGALRQIVLHPTTVELTAGDTVLLYTDGVTDVRPPHELDDDAMLAMAARVGSAEGSAEVVADQLGAELDAILPIPARGDDVAVVVLRVCG